MEYIFRRDNYNDWSKSTMIKIEKAIDSCTTLDQLNSSKRMVDSFIIITSLEEGVETEDIESLVRLFWLRIDLRKTMIRTR